jgi:opacity protein-like surface antigen
MKQFMLLAVSFAVALSQAVLADDVPAKMSAPQRVVRPASRTNARPGYPVSAQSLRRARLAMNVQRTFRNPGPRQTVAMTTATVSNNRSSYLDALRRYRHESHNHDWWRHHFTTIVFVTGGYYYWDAGYWCPAWGYDPAYNNYDYDGPIYTYGDLLPDQVIINVQNALREDGYYAGPLNGSLGPATRAAIANYQRDSGLVVTGAIDEPTVESLGLN